METASPTTALVKMLAPLGDCLNAGVARRIIARRIAPDIQRRREELADGRNKGLLTEAERVGSDSDVEGAGIVSLIALKARRFLMSQGAG